MSMQFYTTDSPRRRPSEPDRGVLVRSAKPKTAATVTIDQLAERIAEINRDIDARQAKNPAPAAGNNRDAAIARAQARSRFHAARAATVLAQAKNFWSAK